MQEKKSNSAVLRIIIWSIVALLLLGLLIAGLNGRFFRNTGRWGLPGISIGGGHESTSSFHYEYGELYSIGAGAVPAGSIKNVHVSWLEGDVNILPGDGDDITFREDYTGSLEDQYKLHYLVRGDTLYIQYCASNMRLYLSRPLGKALTLVLPREHALASFDLEAVSAGVEVDGVNADALSIEAVSGRLTLANLVAHTMEVESVSGRTTLQNITADTLSIEGVSGNVELQASDVRDVECELVSGRVELAPGARVRRIDATTLSGSIRVALPELPGFTARYTEGTGNFRSEYPVEMPGKRTAVYGDGSAAFEFATVSGSIRIEKE